MKPAKAHGTLLRSDYSFFFCALLYILTNIYQQGVEKRIMQTISWDKFGSYLYLPAFFYDDPAKLNHLEELINTYHPGGSYEGMKAMKAPNGNYVMKYSCGQALMFLPGFACGHIAAKIFGYPADGLSLPYQIAIDIESVLIGILGLLLLRRILKKYFQDSIVAATILIIGVASNYYQYVSLDSAFQHVYLFTLYTVIILLSIKFYEQPTYSLSMLLGFCCGWATLTRPTEIVSCLIPFLWGVYDRATIWRRISFLIEKWKLVISFFASAFLIGSLQLLYWKKYAGSWLYFSYGEGQTFSWLRPHIYKLPLSYNNGLFVYTPVMILAVLGFLFLFKKHRGHFWWVLVFMIAYCYPVAAWDNWRFGGSFSMRAMIQSYPVLSFSIAAFIEFISGFEVLTLLTTAFVITCTWLNGIYTYQAYFSPQEIINTNSMTRKYYWRVFGKTEIDRNDKKLMDTDEELPKEMEPGLSEIYFNDLERINFSTDTFHVFSGKHSFFLNESVQTSPVLAIPVNQNEQCWYRIIAKIYAPDMEWEMWSQTQMIVELWQKNQMVKSKMIRVYRVIDTQKWEDVFIDINGAISTPYDSLKVLFWNAQSKKPIYIDDIRVEKFPTEKDTTRHDEKRSLFLPEPADSVRKLVGICNPDRRRTRILNPIKYSSTMRLKFCHDERISRLFQRCCLPYYE